ncbi:protein CEBPZOS-like [Callorhinchus milii]|uniref:protein CEBPZOS-like n=1 Tax=Callorhinchus milii TaxID=7868 RepID=UPI001C3FBBD4|nr:protein CEBPZOS-like [Callorhinchus milii]XP_042189432.1 protein CEBPZOS-like [Callorhinchus milii]XP_042189433.1 protein CEBPZOS-like [Callorhinchus milii]
MAPKTMEPIAKRLFKGILIFEFAGVLGAYWVFQRMNTSQEFRQTLNKRFPSILEVYYKSNEWAGIYGIREMDQETWYKKDNP